MQMIPHSSPTADRELMRLALRNPAASAPAGVTADTIDATIAATEAALGGAKDLPPGQRAAAMSEIADALRPLGIKVMSIAGEDPQKAWLVAITAALSDLPARYVVAACGIAMHSVFRFPNEVEATVRDEAEALVERQRCAIATLERMKREIKRAAQPKLPEPEPQPWTVERIKATPRAMIKMGVNAGWIDADLVAQADAELAAEAEAELAAAALADGAPDEPQKSADQGAKGA